jgi:hypothetical protein
MQRAETAARVFVREERKAGNKPKKNNPKKPKNPK